MAKKQTYSIRSFESAGKITRGDKKATDTFFKLFESLVYSAAFKDLSANEVRLYIYMRTREIGHRKPNRDFDETSPFWDAVKGENCFYFPLSAGKEISTRYQNNMRFYKDVDALINHGFIEKVYNGSRTKEKNIYRYSDKWQTWQPQPP